MNDRSESRIRLCHIISGDLWAGAEALACTLLKGLRRFPDLDFQLILLNEGRLAEMLRSAGLAVTVFDEARHSFPYLVRGVRSQLRRFRPDVIHSHRYKENLLALIGSLPLTTRLIATQHGLPELAGSASVAQRLKVWANFSLLARYFMKTIAVSRDVGRILQEEHRLPCDRVQVIYNGIDLPVVPLPRARSASFVIGSSGRLFPIKGYALLVELAHLIDEPQVRFELAGDGPDRAELERMAFQYRLKRRFCFRGHLERMDSFYRGIDLFVNTSLHEGIPLAVLEAMARGIPVVASAVGGLNEIIRDGVDGFLVGSRDATAFAGKCRLLLQDRALHQQMSCAARLRVEEVFSESRMTEAYHTLYRQLCFSDADVARR